LFAKKQESVRKDVERAFGVLKSRFAILTNGCRLWKLSEITNVMITCIILHNMIVENERNEIKKKKMKRVVPSTKNRPVSIHDYIRRHCEIIDKNAHFKLTDDLVNHVWNHHGNHEQTELSTNAVSYDEDDVFDDWCQ
jgi:hypothetical protein